ncbi:MAG: hypothetical protein Ct9H90mP20_5460 [Candidatus Neomarinimicrobiota bacterium]|nr:MAG: hypothetical protein Ct9H90mP20_5460 [Candidatus Neomarinimicrobiota bacterium]
MVSIRKKFLILPLGAFSRCSSDLDFVLKGKEMGILVISEIEFASWYTKKTQIFGITGSNGKTTTVNLIQKILKSSHLDPVLAGNVGYAFSRGILSDLNDEPKERVYILELSSFSLKTFWILNL